MNKVKTNFDDLRSSQHNSRPNSLYSASASVQEPDEQRLPRNEYGIKTLQEAADSFPTLNKHMSSQKLAN